MLPIVNSKSFLECDWNDIQTILDNTDFKESEYLDYKKSFELTEIPKTQKDALDKAKAEFRKDVCAFANAQGGYLIYGIKEDGKAVPHELVGIEISDNNTEQFENIIKNTLQTVSPRIPHFELSFIPNGENYIVVLRIYHDFFAPYVFVENNQDYRVYKRVGNSVKVMTYVEMKTMFTQSVSLEKELELFRKERISYYQSNKSCEKFILFHIIPDTFNDSSYNQPVFVLEKKSLSLSRMFLGCVRSSFCQPIVDGFRCNKAEDETECRLYNSGIAECFIPAIPLYMDIGEYTKFPTGFFREEDLWDELEKLLRSYIEQMMPYLQTQRVFACCSVVGCKDVVTAVNAYHRQVGSIDRDSLICTPISFESMDKPDAVNQDVKRMRLEFLLSLGIRTPEKIDHLIKEVYDE